MILEKKYRILLNTNHIEALKCLEDGLELVKRGNADESDLEWIAVALVVRGDYEISENLNYFQAFRYYQQAYQLFGGRLNLYNHTVQTIIFRLTVVARTIGLKNEAIELGELLVGTACRNQLDSHNAVYLIELIEAYLSAGRLKEASELFSATESLLYKCYAVADRTMLLDGRLKLLAMDYNGAAKIFTDLLAKKPKPDIEMWAERYLAKSLYEIGDDNASSLSDSIAQRTKNETARHLWFISPRQRINCLQFCEESVDFLISMPDNERSVMNAAELNFFKKSLLFRSKREIDNAVSSTPKAREDLATLDSLKNMLRIASNRNDTIETKNLHLKVDEYEQLITNRFVKSDLFRKNIDVATSDITSYLDEDCVAIDFMYHDIHDKLKIGAFLHSKKNKIKYIPLYEGTVLPSNISSVIWTKLYPEIHNCHTVYFSADGKLNNIPLEYSGCGDLENIGDIFEVHRLFHLKKEKTDGNYIKKFLFIGVSDHNSPVVSGQNLTRGNWSDLHNVKEELNSLRRHLDNNSITSLLDDTATEEQLMNLDKTKFTTIHVSTHGVYRDFESLESSSENPNSDDYHIARRLLGAGQESLSALILRQGNLSWNNTEILEDYDDLLTAEEIENLRFPNLQLTVLSACDTGLGDTDSEGVWGLQRAFRIAGTKSLICTLSKVDDYWAAQFMDIFYEQAALGKSIYDSFHTAQRWLRDEQPDRPEVWSSFILIE